MSSSTSNTSNNTLRSKNTLLNVNFAHRCLRFAMKNFKHGLTLSTTTFSFREAAIDYGAIEFILDHQLSSGMKIHWEKETKTLQAVQKGIVKNTPWANYTHGQMYCDNDDMGYGSMGYVSPHIGTMDRWNLFPRTFFVACYKLCERGVGLEVVDFILSSIERCITAKLVDDKGTFVVSKEHGLEVKRKFIKNDNFHRKIVGVSTPSAATLMSYIGQIPNLSIIDFLRLIIFRHAVSTRVDCSNHEEQGSKPQLDLSHGSFQYELLADDSFLTALLTKNTSGVTLPNNKTNSTNNNNKNTVVPRVIQFLFDECNFIEVFEHIYCAATNFPSSSQNNMNNSASASSQPRVNRAVPDSSKKLRVLFQSLLVKNYNQETFKTFMDCWTKHSLEPFAADLKETNKLNKERKVKKNVIAFFFTILSDYIAGIAFNGRLAAIKIIYKSLQKIEAASFSILETSAQTFFRRMVEVCSPESGLSAFHSCIFYKNEDRLIDMLVHFFIEEIGVDVNFRTEGHGALMYGAGATATKHDLALTASVTRWAKARDNTLTLLHFLADASITAKSPEARIKLIRLLVKEKGCDPKIGDRYGHTPLNYAIESNDTLRSINTPVINELKELMGKE